MSFTNMKCRDAVDCNLNGRCGDDGRCSCKKEEGVSTFLFFFSLCESPVKTCQIDRVVATTE